MASNFGVAVHGAGFGEKNTEFRFYDKNNLALMNGLNHLKNINSDAYQHQTSYPCGCCLTS